MRTPDPGWYPDPQDRRWARWWDGAQWTAATHQASTLPRGGPSRRVIGDNYARLAFATQLMLAVAALVDVGVLWADRFLLNVAEQFRARQPDIEDADTADRLTLVSTSAQGLMLLLTGIVFIAWLFQSHKNNRTNRDQQQHGSGWAIGGWFVPILGLWRPFGVAIDVRRGIHGAQAQATPLMWLWWLVFLASRLLALVASAAWDIDPDLGIRKYGERMRTAAQIDIAFCVVDIVAAVLAILVVRHLTRLVREAPVVS